MVSPAPGTGQVCMTTEPDCAGRLLRPEAIYRLRVPGPVPVRVSWSLTLNCETTRRPYDNGGDGARSVSLESRDELIEWNTDGSIDL